MTAFNMHQTIFARSRRTLAAAGALLAASAALGQAGSSPIAPSAKTAVPAPAAPVFEVAAIHLNKDDRTGHSHIVSSSHDGNFTAINVSLKSLLQWAFNIPDSRILGGPAWLDSVKFNIEARADDSIADQLKALASDAGRLEKRQMLQALLADRFQLKTHQESRDLPIYTLVVAKKGPKFQPSQVNGTTVNSGRGEITVRGSDNTIALLADALGRALGRPVLDKTGLSGRYDLTLKWTPDEVADRRSGSSPASVSLSDSSLPSIFTAIQEQLGLKLKSGKGPVPVLIVDSVQMPSEN